MPRKTASEGRSEKLVKLNVLRAQIAKIEGNATKRIGRLAIRAGLAELNMSDGDLLRELLAIAARFRNASEIAVSEDAHAPLPGGQTVAPWTCVSELMTALRRGKPKVLAYLSGDAMSAGARLRHMCSD
jgi:hypothetical protein